MSPFINYENWLDKKMPTYVTHILLFNQLRTSCHTSPRAHKTAFVILLRGQHLFPFFLFHYYFFLQELSYEDVVWLIPMSTSRNEMALFEALTGWLRYSVGNRQKYLSSTMSLIKFRKVKLNNIHGKEQASKHDVQ